MLCLWLFVFVAISMGFTSSLDRKVVSDVVQHDHEAES